VQEREDYDILISYLKNVNVHPNYDHYLRDLHELGEDGVPMVTLGITPFQQLWIEWVSLFDLSMHLADFPDVVEECVRLMNVILRKQFAIVRDACREIPIHFVNFPDNVTAPVIGDAKFRKYCVPLYNEMAEMLDDSIPVIIHMDGDLKSIYSAIGESKIGGIDSFSPPPDNDTSVAEALAMWPKMRILVNFPSSVHLSSAEQIYTQAINLMEEGGASGRMWIQISEDMPADAWKKSFPEIVRAINS